MNQHRTEGGGLRRRAPVECRRVFYGVREAMGQHVSSGPSPEQAHKLLERFYQAGQNNQNVAAAMAIMPTEKAAIGLLLRT